MEHALKTFQNNLPTLVQIKEHNKGRDVPPETAWIWGKDDEVCLSCLLAITTLTCCVFTILDWAYKPAYARESRGGKGEGATGW